MMTTIPLNKLVLSPLNVRKTPPPAPEQAELAASILAHGLLENLIVNPGGHGHDSGRGHDHGHYEVLAGGRRLMAMQDLAHNGDLAVDYPVACLVHEGDGHEVSLAENIVRLSMHPLDQFEAFAALADQGLDIAQIASRFGHSEHLVRQRLRLGRIAQQIREAYRNDVMSLETLMAFAMTEDHGQQLAAWNEIKDGYIHAHHVRRLLSDEKIAASSKLVRFIGQEAYEAAGGTVFCDLFSEGEAATWLDDRPLVMRLVQEKLDAVARDLQAAEGWKWAQAAPDMPWSDLQHCQTIYPGAIEPTPAQTERMEGIEGDLERYEAMDGEEGLGAEDLARVAALEDEYEALEDSLKVYAPDDLARAGCMVALDHDGDLSIKRGLVLPQDQRKEPDSVVGEATAPARYSAKLLEDLGNFRLEVAQKHLARDFDCAFDIMLFAMAHGMLKAGYVPDNPLDLSVRTTLPHNWTDRFGTTGAEQPADIDLDWLAQPSAEGFKVLEAMDMADKQRLFAYCTALGLRGGLGDEALHNAIGCRLGIDMAAHWRPTARNFFKRVNKARALEIASGVLGEEWASVHKGGKKCVLSDVLEANFTGNRTPGVTAEQALVASRWLPEGMAYGEEAGEHPVEATGAAKTASTEPVITEALASETPDSEARASEAKASFEELPEAFEAPVAEPATPEAPASGRCALSDRLEVIHIG